MPNGGNVSGMGQPAVRRAAGTAGFPSAEGTETGPVAGVVQRFNTAVTTNNISGVQSEVMTGLIKSQA